MDEYSETSKLPDSREKRIEEKQCCEEKQIADIPNADRTLQDFKNLRLDESSMPSTSGKIPKTSRKTHRESDDLDTSKKSWSDVQYSPYKVIVKKVSGRASVMSKLQDLAPSVLITDAERRDPKGESSAVGSITSEGGIEKSPERQISEWEISDRCTEPMSYDSRRKNRKRKSDETTTEIRDLEEPSENARDIEGGSSGHKQRKSEKDHATQSIGENGSELEETKTPLKIILTPVPAKVGNLDYSIKKSTMDEPSAQKITRRTEVPDQTLSSKISSTIDEEFGKSPDPAKPSTSGENLVPSKKQSNAKKKCQVLANTKMEIRRLNIYQFLKLSEKEDQIFDEQCLDQTMRVMTSEIERQVKTFFKEHLTNIHNPRPLLSKARKLENSLAKINEILWDIPKLHLQNNANAGGKTLLDLILHLKRGPLRRAIMGESFDLSKIDEVQLMKKYDAYVRRWVFTVNYYEDNSDDVYKKIEALQTILNEAIENCEERKKFITQLDKSQLLRDIAVLQRSHQIGEGITQPPHVSYNVPDSYLEKVKDAYLNPIPCTDELHALHHQRSASCSDMDHSLNESRDCQPLISFEYSKDFENVEKAITEFLQKDSSDENEMENFQGKELSELGLNPNTSKNLPGQLLISSSDVQQSSTDQSNQLTQTMGSTGLHKTSTDTTSQPQFQPIPFMGASDVESVTDTEYQHFQQTSVIVCNRNIQQSITEGSQLFQLLTGSNDGKKQTDTKCKLNQLLGCSDVQQRSTDPNCQAITTFGEKIKMSCNPDNLVQRSQELQEHEAYASDSKEQNKSDKISSDTYNCEPLDLSSSADDQFIELSEQKTVIINPESSPIKNPPRNQITSTPIKRADGREHMDNRELLEDSVSEIDSLSEIESPDNFSVGSSCDSEFIVCNKSMEIDEMNDQLSLLLHEIEDFGKNLRNLVNETQDAVKKLVDSKEKFNQNLMQFLRTKIPDLIRKNK